MKKDCLHVGVRFCVACRKSLIPHDAELLKDGTYIVNDQFPFIKTGRVHAGQGND